MVRPHGPSTSSNNQVCPLQDDEADIYPLIVFQGGVLVIPLCAFLLMRDTSDRRAARQSPASLMVSQLKRRRPSVGRKEEESGYGALRHLHRPLREKQGRSASAGQHSTLATPGQLTQHPQGLLRHSHDWLTRVPTLGYYKAWTVQSKGHVWANLSVAIGGGLLGPRAFPDQAPACRVRQMRQGTYWRVPSPRLPAKSLCTCPSTA